MIRPLISKLRSDLLMRNALALMINTGLGSLFGLLFWVLAANRNSTAQLGVASAIISLLPLAATVGGIGLDAAVFRHFAQSSNPRRLITRSILISAGLSSIIGFTFGLLRSEGSALTTLLLTSLAAAALGVNAITASAITASRRPVLLIVESSTAAITKILTLLILPANSTGLLTAAVAGIFASALTSTFVLYRFVRPSTNSSPVAEKVTRYALSNWVASSFSLLPFAALPMLVVWRAGAEAAAFVAVAALISPLLRIVPTMVTRSFFAEVAAHPERITSLLARTYRLSLLTTTLLSSLVAIAAPYVLTLFGTEYRAGSTSLLRYLALATVIATANYLADAILNLMNDHSAFLFTNITGMLTLSAILVFASTHGAVGIGLAWVVGESLYAILSWTTILLRHRTKLFPSRNS